MKRNTVTIGVCGTIGASNIDNYILLLQQFYTVNVILTENSKRFLSTEVIRYFSNQVYTQLFDGSNAVNHVNLGKNSDHFIIIPASANTIGKIANGIADDLLTTTALNYTKNLLIAPNMNQTMWENNIVQDNVNYLKSKGHIFLNKTKKSYEVYDHSFHLIDSGLPSPEELIKFLVELDKEAKTNSVLT
ncbi:MAG: flavoprotein [Heyndrickxia sp.]